MAFVGNRYYNNPEMGQAFEGLAKLFAPPGAGELAAYATAKATREKAARLQSLYDAAATGASREQLDALGVGSGAFSPNQTYYSVDLDDATKRRGQDQTLEGTKYSADRSSLASMYGHDQTFKASRLNNADDNKTKLDLGAAENRTKLDVAMLDPVARDATRFVPPALQQRYGVPPVQIGTINAGEGDTVRTPDGQTVVGAPKPMTREQVEGAALQDARNAGLVTNRDVADKFTGAEAPVQTVGPDGKPVYSTPGAAARTGAQAYNKPTAEQNTEISKLIAERDALPAGDPNRRAYDQRIDALGRGQKQSKYDETNEENLGKLNEEIDSNARSALADHEQLAIIDQALKNPGVQTGQFGSATLALRKTAAAFGVPQTGVSDSELISGLGKQIALRLRDPSNGAGMPGAMSDSDRAFLASMAPGLENTPAGNAKLVAYFMRVQARNIGAGQLREDYVFRHGRLDEGFRSVLSNYMRERADKDMSDIFPETSAKPGAPAGGTPAPAAPAPAPGQSGGAAPVKVTTPAEARKLPSGTQIELPDGSIGKVP